MLASTTTKAQFSLSRPFWKCAINHSTTSIVTLNWPILYTKATPTCMQVSGQGLSLVVMRVGGCLATLAKVGPLHTNSISARERNCLRLLLHMHSRVLLK